MTRSATRLAVTVAVAESPVGSLVAVAVAVLGKVPGWVTSAVTRSVAGVAGGGETGRLPTVHTPATGSYVPCDGVAETKLSPGGTESFTTTPMAGLGPRLRSVTV